MSDVTFGLPWALGAGVLTVMVFAAATWSAREGTRRARLLSRSGGGGRAAPGLVVLAIAGVLAIVAAAAPRWGTEDQVLERRGADLVVVLDLSRSMDARDVTPSRLEAAKAAIVETFERVNGGRVGLVIFAGSARVRLPLTTDIQAAIEVVQTLETGTVLVGPGSSPAAGLTVALESLESAMANPGEGLVLLITDGEDLGEPAETAAAAAAAAAAGIDLFVAGAGTAEGATVPVFDVVEDEYRDLLDAAGRPVLTRLNEEHLRLVASAGGGRYLGPDLGAAAGAVRGRLAALEQVRFDERASEQPIERFQWFAALALGGIVLATVIDRLPELAARRVRAGIPALIIALLAGSCATAAYDANTRGQEAFEAGDYAAAISAFHDAQVEAPDDWRVTLNLAAAYHAASQYDDAARAARRALQEPHDEAQARAYASLGHHLFAAGDLEGALEAFRGSLLRDPEDDTARRDYEVVLALLTGGEPPVPGDGGPGEGGEPGASPGPGEGDPGDGEPDDGEPGDGEPGEGEPGDGQPGGEGGEPGSSGQQLTPEELEGELEAIDAEVARLLADAGETPSAQQALEILELLSERARIAALRGALDGSAEPGDY